MLRGLTPKSLNVESLRPRYKNGTSSSASFVFPSLPYRVLQSDRCLVITTFWNLFAPFHGGNTGSNPVGDAHKTKNLARTLFFLRGTAGLHIFIPPVRLSLCPATSRPLFPVPFASLELLPAHKRPW